MSDFRPDLHLTPSEKDKTYLVERPLSSVEAMPLAFRFTFGGAYVQTPSTEGKQHRSERRGMGQAEGDLADQGPRTGEQKLTGQDVLDAWRDDTFC